MEMERVRTVVLAGGRSERMGFDKLCATFAGEPLARRIARALGELAPLFVATPAVCALVADLPGVRVVVTQPTAGPAQTLALAHAALPPETFLAVVPGDVPFIDASRVRAFVERVPSEVDLAWPVVGATPGHPVLWSPKARARIGALRADDPPARVRNDRGLRVAAIELDDDAYVSDVDTPADWSAAERRAQRSLR